MTQIRDEGGRFVIELDGHLSYLAYRMPDDRTIEYYSTFVPPELRGRDLGLRLVRHGLGYARERGLTVVPTCQFVKRVMAAEPG